MNIHKHLERIKKQRDKLHTKTLKDPDNPKWDYELGYVNGVIDTIECLIAQGEIGDD